MNRRIILLVLSIIPSIHTCVTFLCINSCGSGTNTRGYKLILANNRDEEISRKTVSALEWPKQESIETPLVYGPLDVHRGQPPLTYSTWLAMNEFGNVGNLLFFMTTMRHENRQPRGNLVGYYLKNNSHQFNAKQYLCELYDHKFEYKDFNLLLVEMSPVDGTYSIYYLNNNNSNSYKRLNPLDRNEQKYTFAISNSDLEHPFRKASFGKRIFDNTIDQYSINSDKSNLIDSLLNDLLLNTTVLYPDENLSKFLGKKEHYENLTSINADYTHHWPNARTRTRTLILVDYDNNVEYFEYNLTFNERQQEVWTRNNLTFKLKPLYLNKKNDENLKLAKNIRNASWYIIVSILLLIILSVLCLFQLIFIIKLIKQSKNQKIDAKAR